MRAWMCICESRLALFDIFCFFQQKTAYDMRISDWSSDVCSSDLRQAEGVMTEETTAQAVPKADPETLVLRGAPGRVIRFRRGAVIAIAALGSTAIVGAAWLALKPATFRMAAGNDDRAESSARPQVDALAGAPKSYGEVPKLEIGR